MFSTNVLLVGGHRKSGTTMLHSLFDGHPQLYVPPHDLNFLYAYYPLWAEGSYSPSEQEKRLRRVTVEDWKPIYERYGLAETGRWKNLLQCFEDRLPEVDLSDIGAVLNFVVGCIQAGAPDHADWLVVKETSTEMYAPWILTNRTNWKFLHLFRDPRDNYAAIRAGQERYYQPMGNDEIDTLSSTIVRFKLGTYWHSRNYRTFGPERYRRVLFENIVHNTEGQMREIADWLSITWADSLCVPTKAGEPFAGNSHEGRQFRGVSSANVGQWRSRIDEAEARTIEFLLCEEMKELGYALQWGDDQISSVHAGDWYAKMNAKYFFADRFQQAETTESAQA